jgi:hypothetical protein
MGIAYIYGVNLAFSRIVGNYRISPSLEAQFKALPNNNEDAAALVASLSICGVAFMLSGLFWWKHSYTIYKKNKNAKTPK